jgi:hypothetical protein
MGENVKAFGSYAEWSLLPVALLASLRLWISINPSNSIAQNCILKIQSERRTERTFFTDFEVFEKDAEGTKLFLRGEFKLTSVDAVKKLKEALRQVLEPSAPPNALLVVATHGGGQKRITAPVLKRAMGELKDLEVLALPEGRGCYVRGHLAQTRVEAMVCDLDRSFDCLSLRILGHETSERPEHAIGRLLAEAMRITDSATLAQILAQQREFPLDLTHQFWESKLLLNANAFMELLLNPLDKVLRDFFRMSTSNGLRHYRWTRSLISLCRLRLTTPGGHALDEAIERTLTPLPVRLRTDLVDRSAADAISQVDEPIRIVMESRPGAGKSTMLGFLKWLATQLVYHHGGFEDRPVIPFFLDLQRAERLAGEDPLSLLIQSDRRPYFKNPMSVFTEELASTAVGVLLANWHIDIFVDGYDHLRSERDKDALNILGEELAHVGARLKRLIVSSRPGFNAERLWEHFFELNNLVIRNADIDQESIRDFIETWFGLIALFAKDEYSDRFGLKISPQQATDDFLDYVRCTDHRFREVVLSTPLLLTIAIAIFFNATRGSTLSMSASESELFEAFLSGKYLPPGESGSLLKMDPERLGQLSFALLMSEDSVLGQFSDESQITVSGVAQAVGTWRKQKYTLDNVSILDSVEVPKTSPKQWSYIHPAFQEFLACRHFVGSIRAINSSAHVISNREQIDVLPMDIIERGGFLSTNLAEVITRLGTQALKFIIGRARQDPEKLRIFLAWLSQDFGLQQYLYDTECLAPAESELEECLGDINRDLFLPLGEATLTIKALLHKLIGHIHYATFNSEGTSREHLEKVIELCDAASFKGSEWYRLFCHDHIQNRATDEIRKSHADRFIAITEQMNPVDKARVRLRLAHFAGHLGNQALRKMDASDNIDLETVRQCTVQGDKEYTDALELRALTFAQFIAPDAPSVLAQARDDLLSVAGQAAFTRGSFDQTASDQERFVGPSQAIGDVAHQLVGRATIRFWKAVEQQMCNGVERAVWEKSGENDLDLATRCWRLANDKDIRAIRGERILKYVIYLAGAKTRKQILHNPGGRWDEVEIHLQREMESVAREFHISLPKGNDYRLLTPGVKAFFNGTRAAYGLTT